MNNKTKKIALLSLVTAMTLSTGAAVASLTSSFSVPSTVIAEEIVLPDGVAENNFEATTVTDGTNFYATLQEAVEAVAGQADAILYCKPGADVGSLQHAPVTANLTVYGNGAYVSGGAERDFDIGNTDPTKGADIIADTTLTVIGLNGCGAWGTKATEHTVNLVFENCFNMGKIFINGTEGTLNITMTDCSFEGVIKEAVYSNANGAITLTNVAFSNLNKAVNLNHKVSGTQSIVLNGCTFTNCGNDVSADQIPVRVLSSVEGGKSKLVVENCSFSGTPEGGADILVDSGDGECSFVVSNTSANLLNEKEGEEMKALTKEKTYYANVAAKVGSTYYTTLQEARTAAKSQTGAVTVEVYDKVTLNSSLSGSYDSITFVGKTKAAEIYLDVQGYITATGKTVSFTDLKLSKVGGGFITNAGFMNVAFGIYDVTAVNYTNCTFLNGAYASSGTVTFEGCTFYKSHEKYGLWAYGNADVVVNECTFDDDRGIKSYAEDQHKNTDLTVSNTDFSKVTDKPAIVLTYGESVTLAGNTYSKTGVLELDLDGDPNGTPITSTDEITCVNDNGACGVLVDGKIYTTVAQAAAVATENSVVTLLHNSTETVTLPEGAVLETNGFTAENVTASKIGSAAKIASNYYATFEEALDALKAGDTLTLMSDVTISGDWNSRNKTDLPITIDGNYKTLKFTGKINDGYNYLSAFTFASAATVKNLTMDMSEAVAVFQNRFSAIAALSDLTVENCKFIGSTTAVKARAVIYGEGPATTGSLNVSVKDCEFTNWGYGVTDEMGGKDTAETVTITGSTFTNSKVQLSASESVTFNGNTVEDTVLNVKSYTNSAEVKVEAMDNAFEGDCEIVIAAADSNLTTNIVAFAKVGGLYYMTEAELLEAIAVEGVENSYKLTSDVTLYNEALGMPAGATFNGNGYVLNGTLAATGDLTFVGENVVTDFSAGSNRTFTIGEGASLEITKTGRTSIGWGNTFNIVGSIDDAKTADKASIKPSFVAAGASFVGTGTNFNVTNAYVKFTAYCSSKDINASGTFNFNVTNSIWEQTGKFMFTVPKAGCDPTFNLTLKDSVFTSTSHVVFAVTKGDIVIDNSNVNVGNAQQLENRSTLTIKNGSVVHATNADSQNAGMPGTTIVDNATYVGTGDFTGAIVKDQQVGTLIVKNKATVSLATLSQTMAYVYEDSVDTFTYTLNKNNTAKVYQMSDYAFDLTTDKTALKAGETLNVTVSVNKDFYSAEYVFAFDATKFSCAEDTDNDGKIAVTTFAGKSGTLATYTLTALNEIDSVTNSDISVNGNALQYKEQALNGIVNDVTGDTQTITVSLNYTAEIVADYVSGYTLVLVSGIDDGYAYDGVKAFYVDTYKAYAILVKGEVTAESIEEKLTKSSGCETITISYNVNVEYVADGVVDLKDATAVYACSIQDFDVESFMELFLRADVNGDKKIGMDDVNAVTANYNK